MKKTSLRLLTGLIAGVIGVMSAQFEINAQVTIQKKSDVVVTSSTNPWAYLVVEGESYASEANDTAGFGFVKVFNDAAVTSFRGNPILATNTTASGNGALFTQSPLFGEHADKATYQVQFATAGTYYIYMRFTMFENGSNLAHYISEDSFFVPPGFNLDPQLDWPLPRGGYAEGCCDTSGFLSIASPGSEGVRTAYRDGSFSNYWEGNFHWNEVKSSQFNNPATQGEPNLRFTYTVTPEMLGTPQNFTISYREAGTTIDLFLFSTHTNLMDVYTQTELDQLIVLPRLTSSRSGDQSTLSWLTSFVGFNLESTPTLFPADWQPVTTPRISANGRNSVTVDTSTGAAYFRLKQP